MPHWMDGLTHEGSTRWKIRDMCDRVIRKLRYDPVIFYLSADDHNDFKKNGWFPLEYECIVFADFW